MARRTLLHIGTSGWIYKDWRGTVYPEGLPAARWLSHYATLFGTVEINNTFYRLPAPDTFRGWRRQTSPGFVFAVKASRFITHLKKLKECGEPLARFFAGARELGPHLGPVLFQLPPFFGRDAARLRAFIRDLPAKVRPVFEFRHPSWHVEEIRGILSEAGAGFCIHDMKTLEVPAWVTAPFAYLRFHGPGRKKYHGRYPSEHLRRWADRIAGFRSRGLEVYAYFNNDVRGYAVTNARELRELLDAPRVARAG